MQHHDKGFEGEVEVTPVFPPKSIGEFKRIIIGGGFYVNGMRVNNPMYLITVADFKDGIMRCSIGKKNHFVVRAV